MVKVIFTSVSKFLHGKNILTDVTLALYGGRIYGLQGINGSGKTMLMRTMLGLIRPSAGIVEINDKRLGQELDFPESVGFLLENPVFLDRYSGYENLRMIAAVQGIISSQEIWQQLKDVGLSEETGKMKYRKYSLGMKQRLGIAAALMGNPAIIILDEPMNGLDEAGVCLVKQLIVRQKQRGALILLACHDFEVLEALADEIIELKEGCVTGIQVLTEEEP